MVTTLRRAAAAFLALALLAACSSGKPKPGAPQASQAPPAAAPSSGPAGTAPPLADAHVRLERVATIEQPVAMAAPAGDTTVYLAEKTGRVRAIRGGKLDPAPVLDLSTQVSSGGEQGLLGIAFSLDERKLYVDYTDVNGDTRVAEYAMRAGRASRRELLFVKQPFPNHNGGQLAVGPHDGDLYIAFGDGGSGGDPMGNGQSLGTLLGKILRIDPRHPAGGLAYGIPAGNPFAGRAGARAEIWEYGLRNPWRFSFDAPTGDLWIGDVGQSAWEEVDRDAGDAGGHNYGWNLREGSHKYTGGRPPGEVDPVLDYPHPEGCTVIGGYVYRGRAIPALAGAYVYGDYCAGFVRAVRLQGGAAPERRDLGLKLANLSSFGLDQHGELWALSLDGGIYQLVPA